MRPELLLPHLAPLLGLHLVEPGVDAEDAVDAPAGLEGERVRALADGVAAGELDDLGELPPDMHQARGVGDALYPEVEVGVVAVRGEVALPVLAEEGARDRPRPGRVVLEHAVRRLVRAAPEQPHVGFLLGFAPGLLEDLDF